MTTPPKSWSGFIPIPCPWLLPPTQQEATNKTARRGSKAPTPTNIHNLISINRSWFYAEYSMTIMTHDHTTKIMICLATIPCHHVHPYLPINQQHSPNSKSFEFVMARAIVPWHSTIHHHQLPKPSTINIQTSGHDSCWSWLQTPQQRTPPTPLQLQQSKKCKGKQRSNQSNSAHAPIPSCHLPVTLPLFSIQHMTYDICSVGTGRVMHLSSCLSQSQLWRDPNTNLECYFDSSSPA